MRYLSLILILCFVQISLSQNTSNKILEKMRHSGKDAAFRKQWRFILRHELKISWQITVSLLPACLKTEAESQWPRHMLRATGSMLRHTPTLSHSITKRPIVAVGSMGTGWQSSAQEKPYCD